MPEGMNGIFAPNPLPVFVKKTEEMKRFEEVSYTLFGVGITGENNMIEACNILGYRPCEERRNHEAKL